MNSRDTSSPKNPEKKLITRFKANLNDDQKSMVQEIVNILHILGFPLEHRTQLRRERMALALLALGDLGVDGNWPATKDLTNGRKLRTREIIEYNNRHFGTKIGSGSYDDIRREDLLWPVLSGIVVSGVVLRSGEDSGLNDGTRGYSLNPQFAKLLRSIGSTSYGQELESFLKLWTPFSEILTRPRDVPKVAASLPSGEEVKLGPGKHNELIKAVIEEFLGRHAFDATHPLEVLYVGDADNRTKLIHENARLEELGFFTLDNEELPDVVAYCSNRNWLFVIEAVHTSGPISKERHLKFRQHLSNSKTGIVYVTAFWDRMIFRKHLADIAWETEIWIATEPDHMVHFNGDRFLGPHTEEGTVF